MDDATPNARSKRTRRTLLLIAAVCIAPIVASYAAYYLMPRDTQVNYGKLLATQPAPAIAGTADDGSAFALDAASGHWRLVVIAPGACDATCRTRLYATRQARTIQGREQERIERVWLVTDDTRPDPALLAENPGLRVVAAPAGASSRMPEGADRIYLVDPLGNQVLAWPADPDIRALSRDLARLLKASRIG